MSAIQLAVVLATLSFAPPADAPAGPQPGLSFADGIPARERGPLAESFERVIPKACEPPPCTKDCDADASSVALTISGDSRDYELHWVASDPRLDAPLRSDSTCELCSLVEVEEQLASDLGALCTRLAALDQAPGRVHVSAEPDNAWVAVDGRRRGRAPWVGELPAGDHRLEVGSQGYRPQERNVIVVGGVEGHEHFELLAITTRRRPAWPGWTSLGLGVALGIAGTAFIALQDKEWQGRCSGVDIDAFGHCRYVYVTRPLGIGLAVAGAATFATGVGLIVWANREQRSGGLAVRGSF